MSSENIFSALAKQNSANEENYLTDAFVFLINSLLSKERPIGLEILAKVCVEDNKFSFDMDEVISVSTQETIEQGILDIRVSSPNKLIYIEVKDYSSVYIGQLKRYKDDLEKQHADIKRLILLTRFPVDFSEHQGIPDKHVRWFEVYNWLVSARSKAQGLVGVYLIESFMSFLEVKRMSIEKVGWEYINGRPAFNNLISMIEEAIQGASLHISSLGFARQYLGFYFENGEFWCGISLNKHLFVIFEIGNKEKFDTKLIDRPSYMREGNNSIFFDLEFEDIHFFSLDKDKQLEEITKFVKECYAQAQQMRIKS